MDKEIKVRDEREINKEYEKFFLVSDEILKMLDEEEFTIGEAMVLLESLTLTLSSLATENHETIKQILL